MARLPRFVSTALGPLGPLAALTALAAPLAPLATGCSDDEAAADGTLQVTIYGEEFIEDEIPGNDVADGWTIDFTRFLVTVHDVEIGKPGADPVLSLGGGRVFDLAKPSNTLGHVVGAGDVPGGTYRELAYTVGPAVTGTVAGNATAGDVTEMIAGGFSVFVEGSASKSGQVIDFAWGFTTSTRYAPCATSAMVDGGRGTSQITIHADHLFYDSLVSETPAIRFQLAADADTNDDDAVTLDELAAVDITGLDNYQVGNATDVTNLRRFIEAQVPTLGHVDGEGHCETAP